MTPRTASAEVLTTAVVAGVIGFAAAMVLSHAQDRPEPPGADKTAKTRILEAGSKVLQSAAPPAAMDIHLHGFHVIKDQPGMQMEAHHFCRQLNQDFAQCALFDGNGQDANLSGVEYIISARLFASLPVNEQKYWHPHNGEILSGQLVAPGLPAVAEKALMKDKMNSYGKTWHLWHTGIFGSPSDRLPLGPSMLGWSFSRDGEAIEAMVQQRDRRMGVDSGKKRRERADLIAQAQPQSGVDDMKGQFGRPTQDIPGVRQAR